MEWTRLAFRNEIDEGKFDIGDHSYGVPTIYAWNKKSRLTIGRYCSIAGEVRILLGGNHHTDWVTTFPLPVLYGATPGGVDVLQCERDGSDVTIGNDVWIGQGASILSGVTIGNGAVIGAFAVVRSDVAAYSIVMGNPAYELRKRFNQETIDRLQEIRWWNWPDHRVAETSDILLSGRLDMLATPYSSPAGVTLAQNSETHTSGVPWHRDIDHHHSDIGLLLHDARAKYLDLLVKCIANTIYGDGNHAVWQSSDYDAASRHQGTDWPEIAHSMIGVMRLENLRKLSEQVIAEAVPGDLIETGVWRGGACILMRGVLKAYNDKTRRVFVADSFQGLPAPDETNFPADAGQSLHLDQFLAISQREVAENFAAYDLLDEQVEFVPGWFKDTLHKVNSRCFAVIRLDGDLYSSTHQALEALYDRLSAGGFVIIDDYGSWPNCQQAVKDFRAKHSIDDPIIWIDSTGVYWRKTAVESGHINHLVSRETL